MKNFLLNLSVITAISGAASYVASRSYSLLNFELISFLCIYFFIITALTHYLITRTETKTTDSKFVFRFMLVTVLKLFLSIVILIGYALLNPESAVSFIILFAGNYLLFTTFEVISLMRHFKRNG